MKFQSVARDRQDWPPGSSGASPRSFRVGQIARYTDPFPPIASSDARLSMPFHLADLDRQGESSRFEPEQSALGSGS